MARSRSSTSAGTSSRRTYLRAGGGDLQRQLLEQRLEVVGARDEVGLAVELDEDADLAALVDVGADQALARCAAGLLGGLREPALAQDGRRLFDVAIGLPAGRPCTPSCRRPCGRAAS